MLHRLDVFRSLSLQGCEEGGEHPPEDHPAGDNSCFLEMSTQCVGDILGANAPSPGLCGNSALAQVTPSRGGGGGKRGRIRRCHGMGKTSEHSLIHHEERDISLVFSLLAKTHLNLLVTPPPPLSRRVRALSSSFPPSHLFLMIHANVGLVHIYMLTLTAELRTSLLPLFLFVSIFQASSNMADCNVPKASSVLVQHATSSCLTKKNNLEFRNLKQDEIMGSNSSFGENQSPGRNQQRTSDRPITRADSEYHSANSASAGPRWAGDYHPRAVVRPSCTPSAGWFVHIGHICRAFSVP